MNWTTKMLPWSFHKLDRKYSQMDKKDAVSPWLIFISVVLGELLPPKPLAFDFSSTKNCTSIFRPIFYQHHHKPKYSLKEMRCCAPIQPETHSHNQNPVESPRWAANHPAYMIPCLKTSRIPKIAEIFTPKHQNPPGNDVRFQKLTLYLWEEVSHETYV